MFNYQEKIDGNIKYNINIVFDQEIFVQEILESEFDDIKNCDDIVFEIKGGSYFPDITPNNIIKRQYNKFPLYAYVHSNVAFSMQPFSCQWDSGQAGFVYTKKKNNITDKQINDRIKHLQDIINGYIFIADIEKFSRKDENSDWQLIESIDNVILFEKDIEDINFLNSL